MLEQKTPKEGTRSFFILFIDHQFIKVHVGGNVSPKLDANHSAIHLCTEVGLLFDRADLNGKHLEREYAAD